MAEEKKDENVEISEKEHNKVVEENKQLKAQLEGLVKRYKKLTFLYNDALEKFLSE